MFNKFCIESKLCQIEATKSGKKLTKAKKQQQEMKQFQQPARLEAPRVLAAVAAHLLPLLLLLVALSLQQVAESAPRQQQQSYYGTLIGKLNRRQHNVSGDVYAVDEQTLFIKSFSYDGSAPDAYFWSSAVSGQPAAQDGFIVPDEKGSTKPLERYQDKDVVLRLPEGKTLREIHWLCVWSRQTRENLGEIMVGRQLAIPRPLEIGPLSQLAHGVRSGPITIVDAQTFLLPDFHYDGLGPEAFFWLSRGSQGLGASGLRLKDENGSAGPLHRYAGETVVISLPDDLTIYDFDYFGVWCRKYQVNFGQTRILQSAKVPPSPKMLGIKPENKLNCEILYDDLGYEIRWVLDGDDIVMQLVGKIEPGEYMAFGLGKDDARSDMGNADAVVTWVDRTSGQVHAVDYFLGGKQQCVNDPRGSCPDSKLAGASDSLTLLHGAIVNGYSMVTFKRPQLGVDDLYDQHVYSDGQQSVLWAIGSLNANNEIGYHRLRTRSNMFIDFARNPQWNCPIPDLNATMHNTLPAASASASTAASQIDLTLTSGPGQQQSVAPELAPGSLSAAPNKVGVGANSRQQSSAVTQAKEQQVSASQVENDVQEANKTSPDAAWFIPPIVCPAERTLYAQIGPTGGRRGHEALTGRTSWGVSWYINGIMIPELVLERGQSYLFVVEGGNDKTSATRRHPFYLTDSPEGGFDFKTDEERLKERIYAGVALRADGQLVPTAEGRLCEWKPTNATLQNADLYPTFASYQRSLKLDCLPGQASVLKFVPDSSTPDLIYYQCYTHRFMGWRVRIVDSCSAYLDSSSPSQRAFGNNNIKRDTANKSMRSHQSRSNAKRQTYDRRYSMATDSMKTAATEQRVSYLDFADDTTASTLNNELTTIPNDMIILNSSHLTQKQPLNISSFEEILKLSPADIEFIDNQAEIPLEPFAQASPFPGLFPLSLPLQNFTGFAENHSQNVRPNKTGAKLLPKTLHSYMRRLAAIYYPVQQQLSSMLASQSGPAPPQQPHHHQNHAGHNYQQTHQHLVGPKPSPGAPVAANGNQMHSAASTEQVSTFLLSNLVPKPKIDLSKSGIGKKLNKLRFKQPKDTAGQKPSQPPTPAIEFNYDIFNNQLAQLEKQQQQLQSMDHFISWPPQQQQVETLPNYLPMMSAASSGDQPAVDTMGQQQQLLANLLSQNFNNNNQLKQHSKQSQLRAPPLPPGQRVPVRQQQPYAVDYLAAMMFNRTNELSPQSQQNQWPTQPQAQMPGPKFQQPSVYITRLPLQHTYPIYIQQQQQQQQSQPQPQIQGSLDTSGWPTAANMGAPLRYPNIHPYASYQRPGLLPSTATGYRELDYTGSHMTTMPSVAQTTHDTRENAAPMGADAGQGGGYFELKSQQSAQGNRLVKASEASEQSPGMQTAAGDTDHMLAIERFSKQPSERRPPSIVHPVTGEQVRFASQQQQTEVATTAPPPTNSSGSQQARRFSNVLIDKHLLASSEPLAPIQTNDLLEVDQSQSLTSDFRRLNASDNNPRPLLAPPPSQGSRDEPERRPTGPNPAGNTQPQQQDYRFQHQQQQPTTESAAHVLVRPSYFHFQLEPPVATTTPSMGPLIPSLGPPTIASTTTTTTSSSSQQTGDPETVLKSTLIEPITSTLIQNQAPVRTNAIGASPFLSQHHFDPSPFTPIELTSPFYYTGASHQAQQIPANLMAPRLRPPAFIESMLSQHRAPFRPEPPVQVASYLAQHLSSHSPMLIASEKSVASSQPMALSMALPSSASGSSTSGGGGNSEISRDNPNAAATSNDLIILKPAMISKQAYLLRPEYMSHPKILMGSGGQSLIKMAPPDAEPHYSTELGPSRRLAGHQFDRLSSLSSPPSTSMAVDPMQTANTVTSFVSKHSSASQPPGSNSSRLVESQQAQSREMDSNATLLVTMEATDKIQAQHRQSHTPIRLNYDTQNTSSSPEGVRLNPGGENINTLYRDNNTDNAILSHVMSLISSNAIPTPPLVPVASFSSADYFLPSSDRAQRSISGSQ